MPIQHDNPYYISMEDGALIKNSLLEANTKNGCQFAKITQFKEAIGYYELFLEEVDLVERSRKRQVALLNYIKKRNHLKRDKEGNLLKIQPGFMPVTPIKDIYTP